MLGISDMGSGLNVRKHERKEGHVCGNHGKWVGSMCESVIRMKTK